MKGLKNMANKSHFDYPRTTVHTQEQYEQNKQESNK